MRWFRRLTADIGLKHSGTGLSTALGRQESFATVSFRENQSCDLWCESVAIRGGQLRAQFRAINGGPGRTETPVTDAPWFIFYPGNIDALI